MIYLDSAATSLLKPPEVLSAMKNAINTMASPGRGSYSAARLAADTVYECRELVCRLFHYDKPENVVFSMNATHALNIAIRSVVKKGDRVCVSGYEHNSVTRTLNAVGAEMLIAKSELFDREGTIKAFEKLIPKADAVVCNHVSNVFGFIMPVKEISELCRKYSVPFILDASQSAGIIDIDAVEMYASYIAMPGHKGLMGPQGTGILLCKSNPEPLMFGGTGSESINQLMPDSLPDMLEAGTHNVVGIAGLGEGIKYVLQNGAENIGKHEQRLCRFMASRLKTLEGVEVFYSEENQAGVLSIRHGSINSETLCEKLGENEVAARCGLHCSPFAHKSAGTLQTGTIRFSFSPFLDENDILNAFNIFKNLIICEKLINM